MVSSFKMNYPFLKKESEKSTFWAILKKVLPKNVSIQFKFVFDCFCIPTLFVICILPRPT